MARDTSRQQSRSGGGTDRRKTGHSDVTFRLTRRGFISSAGTVVAAGPLLAAEPARPTFRMDGAALIISFGNDWRIDPSIFEAAMVTQVNDPATGGWTVEIKGSGTTFPRFRGCSLRFDVKFDIAEISGRWMVDFSARGLPPQRAPLSDWCAGTAQFAARDRFTGIALSGMAQVADFEANFTVSSQFHLELVPLRPAIFSLRRFDLRAKSLRITPPSGNAPGDAPTSYQFVGITLQSSQASLDGAGARADDVARSVARARRGDAIAIAGLREQMLLISPGGSPSLAIEAALVASKLVMTARLTDAGASLLIAGRGLKGDVATIRLKSLSLTSIVSASKERCALVLAIDDRVQALASATFAIGITGRGIATVEIGLSGFFHNDRLELPVGLTDVYLPAKGALSCEASFGHSASGVIPDPGLLPRPDNVVGMPAHLLLGAAPSAPVAKAGLAAIRLGTGAFLNVDMANGRLRMRRAADGFDLSFGFVGYALQIPNGKPRLVPIADQAERLQIAHFWPQHILEEVFSGPTGTFTTMLGAVGLATPPTRRAAPAFAPVDFAQGLRSRLARTRLSGPTRVVFDRGAVPAAPIDVTIQSLTAWENLPLKTDRRAARDGLTDDGRPLTLDRQITDIAGISAGLGRKEAREAIRRSFGQTKETPYGALNEHSTALELVTGLQFSPSRDARFRVPSGDPGSTGAEQWSATLVMPKGGAVRAVMSSDLDLRMFDPGTPQNPVLDGGTPAFETALSRGDRRQIVMLSSGFGIAGLRALQLSANNISKDRDGSMVGLPGGSYAYLTPAATPAGLREEGVISPTAFTQFGAKLTSFGADIDIEWKGEPPANYQGKGDPFFQPAFSVQHYTHRTRNARDTFVEVVYKGYLFPLGIRAALIKTTRREAYYDPQLGWVYPLIQREYIVATNPEKSFSGPYSPYDARDMHATKVTMLTLVTPFLDDDSSNNNWVNVPSKDSKAFWVRVGGADFSFEYSADGLAGRRRAPMLFLDNAVINSPATMKAVVEKYQSLAFDLDAPTGSDPARRTEKFDSSEARYAPSVKIGDSNFETDAAILGVRGRLISDKDDQFAPYTMDAFMEGADQPPFYPYLSRARIKVRALERMTGLPSSRIEVRHFEGYRDAGFDVASNPAEIFLRVLTPGAGLGLGSKGEASGGIARPEAPVAALSRSTGLVGGRPTTSPSASLRLASASVDSDVAYDISAASAGRFDPSEFFHGATLLGIVPLELVVKAASMAAAPLMQETLDVAAISAEAASRISAALREADKAISNAIQTANATIGGYLGNPDYTLQLFYPELADSLAKFSVKLIALAKELDVGGNATATLLQSAPHVLQGWPPVQAALEQIARDPMPLVIAEAITDLRTKADAIFAAFKDGGPVAAIVRALISQIEATLLDSLLDALVSSGVIELIFGPVQSELMPDPWEIAAPDTVGPVARRPVTKAEAVRLFQQVVRDPEGVAARMSFGLLDRELGKPLIDFIGMIGRFAGAGTRGWRWPQRALAGAIADALLATAIDANETDLARVRGMVRDATVSDAVEDMAQAVVAALDRAPSPPTTVEQLPSWLGRVLPGTAADIGKALDLLTVALPGAVATATSLAGKWTAEVVRLKAALGAPLADQERDRLFALYQSAVISSASATGRSSALTKVLTGLRTPATKALIVKAILARASTSLSQALAPVADAERTVAEVAAQLKELNTRIFEFADRWKAAAQRAAMGWCTGATPTLSTIAASLVKDLVPDFGTMLANIDSLVNDAALLDIPGAKDTADLSAFRDAAAGARASITKLGNVLVRMSVARTGYLAAMPTSSGCADLPKAFEPLSQLYLLWREAVSATLAVADSLERVESAARAVVDATTRATKAQMAAGSIGASPLATRDAVDLAIAAGIGPADPVLARIYLSLSGIVAAVAGVRTATGGWRSVLTKAMASLPAAEQDRIKQFVSRFDADVGRIVAGANTLPRLRQNAEVARQVVEGSLKEMLGGIIGYGSLGDEAAKRALAMVDTVATTVLSGIAAPVQASFSAITALTSALNGQSPAAQLARVLGKPLLDKLEVARKALEADAKEVSDAQAATGPAVTTKVLALLGRWRQSEPGMVVTVRVVEEISRSVAQGQIGSLLDFSAARQLIEQALLEIVPSKATIDYAWGSDLSSYPESDPIFAMDRSTPYDASYDPKGMPAGDLAILTKTEVSLRDPGKPKFNAVGRLKPFSIHLLGDRFDLVTIRFKGAHFKVVDGGKPEFSADIAGVTIGPMLTFLQALAPFMGGRPDNGPYVIPSFSPAGVEAGYRFSADTIQLGSLQFLNIALSISALLPFEARQAEFNFIFASRERPFLISSAPYGGGGFLALAATGRGIASFELQLEFGAVVDLRLGPFKGHGRVTAGIYIRSGSGSSVLEGFVHAVGEGSIACFSLTVNIEVSVRHANGAMVGQSTYRVTFRVGFAKLKFEITARYNISGSSGASGMRLFDAREMLPGCAPQRGAKVEICMPDKRQLNEWGEYRDLFEDAW